MSYINTTTQQYPVSEAEIRAANPNTSFPVPFAAEGYAWVFPSPATAHDAATQAVREAAPVLTAKGHWEQSWEIIPRFSAYTDAEGVVHTAEEQIAAAQAAELARARAAMAVSPRQIRQALTAAGLRSLVEEAVAAGGPDLKDWWEFSLSIERTHPQVEAMIGHLGVTPEEADDLWRAAAAL